MTAMAVDSGEAVMPAATTSVAVRAVASAFVVTALLLLGILVLIGDANLWRGFAAATVATLLAGVVTVPILAWGMRVGPARPDLAAGAFMITAGVRAVVALGVAGLAVAQGGYPKTQTLLLVVPYYFALLAAETFVLVRLLWKSGPSTKTTEDRHD